MEEKVMTKKEVPEIKFSPAELSYMAGFFEGEGCVSAVKYASYPLKIGRKPTLVLMCRVGNTEKDALELFERRFGGKIRVWHRNPKWKDIWIWNIYAKKALNFLETIEPYLKTKRKQELARLGIEFQKHKVLGGFKGAHKKGHPREYYEFEDKFLIRVRELNKRGGNVYGESANERPEGENTARNPIFA